MPEQHRTRLTFWNRQPLFHHTMQTATPPHRVVAANNVRETDKHERCIPVAQFNYSYPANAASLGTKYQLDRTFNWASAPAIATRKLCVRLDDALPMRDSCLPTQQ